VTTTTTRVNNKKRKKKKKKWNSILDVCKVAFGRGSSGYSKEFRKKSKEEQDQILEEFSPQVIGFTPMTEFTQEFYACKKPFQNYRLIVVDNGADCYFVHKDRLLGRQIRKPTGASNQIGLSFFDAAGGSGKEDQQKKKVVVPVRFFKLVLDSLYPDLCMRQFGTPMFNEDTGKSCGMLTVDHIKELGNGGDHHLSNLQLMCTGHNSRKSQSENKERHVKMGKSKSRSFLMRLVSRKGEHSGLVELESYQKFSSTHDTDTITAFAGGTVYQGNINAMINGKVELVGVKGREEGVYVQIHPDDVRDQKQEHKDFGGKTLDREFIEEALGDKFSKQKSAHKLLFNTNGQVYNNKGQVTRGNIHPRKPFGLRRTFNAQHMHILHFFAHNVPNMSLEEKIAMKKDPKFLIAHDESNPATYVMFECTPDEKRHVNLHTEPMDPPLTFSQFMQLIVPKQKSVRVMYSNRAETLRLATSEENNQESVESMANLEKMHDLYRIHDYQRKNFQ
jgi:hypothetical protein